MCDIQVVQVQERSESLLAHFHDVWFVYDPVRLKVSFDASSLKKLHDDVRMLIVIVRFNLLNNIRVS